MVTELFETNSLKLAHSERCTNPSTTTRNTVYPKKYAHGFVVLCFVVVMQSFIMNSHEVLIHIHQDCFAGTGAIVRLPKCQWSKPDGYGKISQCITTTKHSKAKTACIFLGIYCIILPQYPPNRYPVFNISQQSNTAIDIMWSSKAVLCLNDTYLTQMRFTCAEHWLIALQAQETDWCLEGY